MLAGKLARAVLGSVLLVAVGATTLACEAPESAAPPSGRRLGGTGGAGGASGAGGELLPEFSTKPPKPDAGGYCGNYVHPIVTKAPNLYFVFDASGSMSEVEGSATRYGAVRKSAVDLVRRLGPFINVGAAVFPLGALQHGDACRTGGEVFAVHPGDPAGPEDGPTTAGFAQATMISPLGGTPIAATVAALLPKLSLVAGKTVVLLFTDGGPNCNVSASCAASECIPNIEGACAKSENCCASNGADGAANCLDRGPTVKAIKDLTTIGITTYVIGIPGSQVYASLLNDMAKAGGAPRPSSPFYYRIDDLGGLGDVLGSIASTVVSCEFTLDDGPREPGQTNVYFDDEVLPYDVVDGWMWRSPTEIELRGASCERLKNGGVRQVQIVSGCPTEGPK
jgi:hypothetical protein